MPTEKQGQNERPKNIDLLRFTQAEACFVDERGFNVPTSALILTLLKSSRIPVASNR